MLVALGTPIDDMHPDLTGANDMEMLESLSPLGGLGRASLQEVGR